MQLRAWGGRQAAVSTHQAVDRRACERHLPHQDAAASVTDGRPQGSRVGRKEAAGREAAARPLQRLTAMLPAAAAAAVLLAAPLPSRAVLNSPNAMVARTPEAALRRSIPAFNPTVKQLQTRLEDVTYLLRIPQRKPWASMAANVRSGLDQLEDRNAVLYGVTESNLQRAEELLLSLEESLGRLDLAIGGRDPDKTSLRTAEALAKVAELELLQAPGLEFSVPREYRQLPQLRGRATVELVFEKADGSYAFVDNDVGGVMKQGLVELTLDGYSAPITAGNFASKVLRGTYDGISLAANYDAVTPLPRQKDGYALPLEIRVLGDFEPVYRVPIDVQAGELPVLPLSIDGAVAMAHGGGEQGMESGEDFFIYRFHRQQSGLSALAFDEGTFSVFGYVTKGLTSVVPQLQKGDTLVQARLTSGQDKLVNVQPAGTPS